MSTSKPGVAASQLVRLIEHYQREISGRRPARCRYQPTCSEYMKASILSFGAVRGVWYGTLRLGSCGPWSRRSADDPPPSALLRTAPGLGPHAAAVIVAAVGTPWTLSRRRPI